MELIKPKRVVVERSKWVRGNNVNKFGYSCLYQDPESTGKDGVQRKCCLGFWCEAAGVSVDLLSSVGSPGGLRLPIPLIVDSDLHNSTLCYKMISANDTRRIKDTEREKWLIELAASVDVELVFVD